jgi:Amt family ammonium transporter
MVQRPRYGGGTLGTMLAGVFASNAVYGHLTDTAGRSVPLGLVDGNSFQVVYQAVACAITWAIAIMGSFVRLKICDVVIGLRVHREQEIAGLDVSTHGEEGYVIDAWTER